MCHGGLAPSIRSRVARGHLAGRRASTGHFAAPLPALPPKWRNFVGFVMNSSAISTAKQLDGGKVRRWRERGGRERAGAASGRQADRTRALVGTPVPAVT